MKAAIIPAAGQAPQISEIDKPLPGNGRVLIKVRAAALKQLDRARAANAKEFPFVPGFDAAGELEGGRRVYAITGQGAMAEFALADEKKVYPLPDNTSFSTASVLPNALLGSDVALVLRGGFKKGQTVFINGATGFTGRMAVQICKLRGASKIYVSGRNPQSLDDLLKLGAGGAVSLEDPDVRSRIVKLHSESPFDIVLDYLWGSAAQTLLEALAAAGNHPLNFVSIGQMAGATTVFNPNVLRTRKISLMGSGFGSLTDDELDGYFRNELPGMFEAAASGKLQISTSDEPLENAPKVWNTKGSDGSRPVFTM